jgi:ATP/maltotriose-dependent transcriptional regulator MalT
MIFLNAGWYHTRLCWISLDEEDNDPRLFWTYVLSALEM